MNVITLVLNMTCAPLPQPKTRIQPLIIGQHTTPLLKHMQTPVCSINDPKLSTKFQTATTNIFT